MKRYISLLGTLAIAVTMLGLSGPAAHAGRTFPGANGLIVFNGAENHTLYTIDPVTKVRTVVFHRDNATILGGHFSPDGKHIAFAADMSGRFQLYKIDVDGTNLKKLTAAPGDNKWPSWSPDGDHLAFVSNRSGSWDVYVLDLVNGATHRMTTAAATDNRPDWSPDGAKIAFESYRTGGGDIYTVDVLSHNLIRVTSTPGPDTAPSWAPVDNRIAFDSRRNGQWGIYTIDPNGTNREALVVTAGHNNLDPAFSPDGTMVVYASNKELSNEHYNLFTVTVANPHTIVQLTKQDRTSYRSPDWQPVV